MLTRISKANIRSETQTFVTFRIRAQRLMSAITFRATRKTGFYFEPFKPEVIVPASFNLNSGRNSVVGQARSSSNRGREESRCSYEPVTNFCDVGARLLFFHSFVVKHFSRRLLADPGGRSLKINESVCLDLEPPNKELLFPQPLLLPSGAPETDSDLVSDGESEGAAACAPVMTSGNGTTISSQHNGESNPAQQAVDTPHILTHLIEGFVIQEGAEPFPVERPSFSIESLRRRTADSKVDVLALKGLKAQQEPTLTCELCGKVDFAYIFKRSKRFCSTLCAKRYNVGCTKRMGLFPNRKTILENLKKHRVLNGNHKTTSLESKKKKPAPPPAAAPPAGHSVHPAHGESSQCSDLSPWFQSQDSDLPLTPHSFLPSDPAGWDIEDVYEFISSLPGCLDIAEEFRSQEIDGQALLLLKEDHLMGTMNIKLGPALKIFAQISVLKTL